MIHVSEQFVQKKTKQSVPADSYYKMERVKEHAFYICTHGEAWGGNGISTQKQKKKQ